MQEVFIASACGFQVVGFPNARPLSRSSALDRDRHERLRQILSVSEEAARKLRDYIVSQGHHQPDDRRPKVVPASFSVMPRSSLGNDETARIGAALLGAGLIGLRGSTTQAGVVLPLTFGGRLTLSCSGLTFLFHREALKGVSEHLHWPGGPSGVSIGPGYDMRDRREERIISDLTAIGIDPTVAQKAAGGHDMRNEVAGNFVRDNKKLITLTTS